MPADEHDDNHLPPLRVIGWVRSSLEDVRDAPRQGDEGAPTAWIELDPEFEAAADGLRPGDDIVVVTWLHLAGRDVLTTHPRGDVARTAIGVFATRSPDRPNPLGIHPTRILERDSRRLHVAGLEAIDGTPVVDIKSALGDIESR